MTTDAAEGETDVDVRLSGIHKTFGGAPVVHPLDLSVRRGEFFSLLGPSGCGKTTTLRMIVGLEEPSGGDVVIRGRSMAGIPVNRRPTNLVFQKLALFPHLNVFDNIAFGLRLARVGKLEIHARVSEMLEIVRLPGFENRAIGSLSGGQQQRVAIARALVNRPAVLLLDEPLGALDLQLQLHLQRELKRIQRTLGTTFVYVTHNQTEALAMSDRIAVMNEGRIEQVAAPADLYRLPASSFVAEFMGQTNLLEGRVADVAGDRAKVEAGGLVFDLDVPAGLEAGHKTLVSVRPERLHLVEDVARARLKLIERTFLGSQVLYRFARPDGGELIVHGLAPAGELPRPDETLGIGWAPDAAILVPVT